MRVVRARPEREMVRFAAEYENVGFSYDEVGATERDHVPDGYERIDYSREIGTGSGTFERAAVSLLDWTMHSRAGTYPISSAPTAEPGSDVLLQSRLVGIAVLVPCRVVWSRTTGNERGFAYGTLRDHPEVGEEAFLLRLDNSGVVTFRVYGFSHPASGLPARLRPVTGQLQARAIRRYGRALAEW